MAVLFATSFYLFTILFYSISHSLSIESSAGYPAGWNQVPLQSYFGHEGYRAPVPTFGNLCKNLNMVRLHKFICILCKGLDRSCFHPTTITSSTSTTTSTTPATSTTLTSTTPSTTTTTSTTIMTATPE